MIGEGAYAYVQLVCIPCEPYKVIVKWYKFAGCAERECRQLDELRKYASVKVPESYHVKQDGESLEASVMEYIPGIAASDMEPPNPKASERLAEEIMSALISWHSIMNPAGFGDLDGPFYSNWPDFYQKRMHIYYDEICSGESKGVLSKYVIQTAERSIESVDKILENCSRDAVLVHSDLWMPNVIIDPEQYRLIGIIDPLDAEWGDPEMDLLIMEWPWGEKDYLLEFYRKYMKIPDGFKLRSAFYRFWYAMQNFARIGMHDELYEKQIADELNKAMDEYL